MKRVLTCLGSLCAAAVACADEPVDFTRDIRPILSNHCFACHGFDKETLEGGLSLLSFEDATAVRRGGERGVVPGDPGASRVWQRVSDHEDPMPPVSVNKPLTDEQKDLIRRWIEQGASYKPHWAYVDPERAPVPPGIGDPIDRWIDSRLAAEGLERSAPADAATLLRRVSTDLTGLPPTIEKLDAFVTDASDQAYSAQVDELLASPHYGERMALFWLDLVRYADTVGYHGDQEHNVWPYRDWVIAAFNDNMPFDEFTAAQLAGDLVPDGGQDELVASTYNRLIQTSHEGGVQLKEYRAIYMADRVRNVSAVWMGATVGCAQCHDHKYDPYSMEDYYALGAFFADIDEEYHLRNQYDGLNTSPTRREPELVVYSETARAAEQALRAHVEQAHTQMERALADLSGSQDAWIAEQLARHDRGELVDELWIDDIVDTGGDRSGAWDFVEGESPAPRSGTRYRRQSSSGLVQHYTVETDRVLRIDGGGTFYTWVYLDPANPPRAVMLQFNAGGRDWEHRAVWGDDSIDYGRRATSWPGYRRMGALPELGRWVRLEVDPTEVGLRPEQEVSGWAFTQFGGSVLWDRAGLARGGLSEAMLAALRAATRSEEQQAMVDEAQALQSTTVREARATITAQEAVLSEYAAALPRTLHTQRIDPPREVRVLPRGDWLDESGPLVEPAVPGFMGHVAEDGRATRLDLARWLTTARAEGGVGELTARVLVNRLWAMLMGEGLCPSLEDFGGQGEPPVHAELLDMLALDLMESGWDVRSMVRRIVKTETYRRSSVPAAGVAARDPGNRLFARQSRGRLPAELVRDRMLSASGLLVRDVGGPSVKPVQPAGLYRHLNFPPREYMAHVDQRQWRRGLYVHRQRQFLHPMLLAFDAPMGTVCTAERPTSNTPLAALNLLNDPIAVESARALARRVLDLQVDTDRDRLSAAMRLVTGRVASDREVERLAALYEESVAWWAQRPQMARALTGESEDPVLAAWTQVSRALLNLHEAINRD